MKIDRINGLEVKRELINKRVKPEERLAVLSGFVRVCFSVYLRGGERYLMLDCREDIVREYIVALMSEQFKVKPTVPGIAFGAPGTPGGVLPERKSMKTELIFPDCDKILSELDILGGDAYFGIKSFSGKFASLGGAYVRGMFLGCGGFSSPSTSSAGERKSGGYHMEFSFGDEELADKLIELFATFGVNAKKGSRPDKTVVYVKDSEAVSDCLAFIGADNTVLTLNATIAVYAVKGETNRRVNCEMANLSRTVDAATETLSAIETIEKKSGLDILDKKLFAAALARKENPDVTLAVLAELLGISKSGLKHRFDKIVEIARSMEEKDESLK